MELTFIPNESSKVGNTVVFRREQKLSADLVLVLCLGLTSLLLVCVPKERWKGQMSHSSNVF